MAEHDPYIPTTVPALVGRLQANLDRWKALHEAADQRAKDEADRRGELHKEGGPPE